MIQQNFVSADIKKSNVKKDKAKNAALNTLISATRDPLAKGLRSGGPTQSSARKPDPFAAKLAPIITPKPKAPNTKPLLETPGDDEGHGRNRDDSYEAQRLSSGIAKAPATYSIVHGAKNGVSRGRKRKPHTHDSRGKGKDSRGQPVNPETNRSQDIHVKTPVANTSKALVISFGPSGPKNQGVLRTDSSNPRHLLPLPGTLNPELYGNNDTNRRKRDKYPGLSINERLPMRSEHAVTTAAISYHNSSPLLLETKPLRIQQKEGFPVSSQLSRVKENGSPMPFPNWESKELMDQSTASEDNNNTNLSMGDMEGQQAEVELPTSRTALAITNRVVMSVNSKQQPSSPPAPSSVASMSRHQFHQDGAIVNIETKQTIMPSKPEDPFSDPVQGNPSSFLTLLQKSNNAQSKPKDSYIPSSQSQEEPSSFKALLRRSSRVKGKHPLIPSKPEGSFIQQTQEVSSTFLKLLHKVNSVEAHGQRQTAGNGQRPRGAAKRSLHFDDDFDKTLVDQSPPVRPGKRSRKGPTVSSSSSSSDGESTTSEGSRSDEDDDEESLDSDEDQESHECNIQKVLSEIGRSLSHYLAKKEQAVNQILDTFVNGGNTLIDRFLEEKTAELKIQAQMRERAKAKLAVVYGETVEVCDKLGKRHLSQRVEDVEREWRERQGAIKAAFEEAMAACH